MSAHEINVVAIAGAGTMGAGIAQVCALAGFRVLVYDQEILQLDRASETI